MPPSREPSPPAPQPADPPPGAPPGSAGPPAPSLAVAIGASAGGLDGLRQLVPALPLERGAFVVVAMHLSPRHRSLLPELLARDTPARVLTVTSGMRPEPGTVYVVPSARQLRLAQGCFQLDHSTEAGLPRPSIDRVFASMAEAFGPRLVAIVLSGTGSDGRLGAQAVQRAGGLVLVQDPDEARYDAMPRAAIASGAVQASAPVGALAAIVARRLSDPADAAARPPASASADGQDAGQVPEPDHADASMAIALDTATLDRLAARVRAVCGLDLAAYTPATLRRRLARRLRAQGCASLAAYLQVLDESADEARALVQEMLISVTGFFRDPAVWSALVPTLRGLLEQCRAQGRELRLWVAGCATGEEAYTLALLLDRLNDEAGRGDGHPVPVRIFATDVDQPALARARRGRYPLAALDEIPPAWRGPQLETVGDELRMAKPLRDMVLFSEHDLLRDPPFLRIDLLCCRNLLIYLRPPWQQHLVQAFQRALDGQGWLLLGRAESLDDATGFRRPTGLAAPGLLRCIRAPHRGPLRLAPPRDRPRDGLSPRATTGEPDSATLGALLLAAHTRGVLAPGLAMADDGQLVYSFGDLSAYLQPGRGGPASLHLSQLCRPRLWLALRALDYRARVRPGEPVEDLFPGEADEPGLRLAALTLPEQRLTLVMFRPGAQWAAQPHAGDLATDADRGGRRAPDAPAEAAEASAAGELAAMRDHMDATRVHLDALVAELDSANEALQVLNEELQSSNEELQSTNEEFESANEELQSTNEELVTVNDELQQRSAELAARKDDLDNVKNSLVDALVVVDGQGRVLLHNPAAARLWALDGAAGASPAGPRPVLAALPTRLPGALVQQAVAQVLDGDDEVRIDLVDEQGSVWRLQAQPYRDAAGRRGGVVLLLHDITESARLTRRLQAMTDELARAEAFRRATVDALPDQVCVVDDAGRISSVNAAWTANLAPLPAAVAATAGIGADYLATCERSAASGEPLAAAFLDGLQQVRARRLPQFELEYPCTRPDAVHWFRVSVSPFQPAGQAVVVRHQDITLQHAQAEALALQARALDATPTGVVMADATRAHLPLTYVNQAFERLTGYTRDELLGRDCAMLQGNDRRQPALQTLREALDARRGVTVLLRNYRKSGQLFWNELTISMVRNAAGEVTHMLGIAHDVTDAIEAAEALRSAQRREAQALTFAGIGTFDWHLPSRRLQLSVQQARLLGLPGTQTTIGWDEIAPRIDPADRPLIEDAVRLCVARHEPLAVEWRLQLPDGSVRWLQMQGDVVGEPAPERLLGICQDITSRRAAEDRAVFLSQHDVLTGLPNRALMRDRLQTALRHAGRERQRVALMLLDLDRFKEVNDSLGHDAGDELLRAVAERVQASVRSSDTVCRLGGDEFVLLLPAVRDADEVSRVAEKLFAALRQPLVLGARTVALGASIGVSLFPEDGTDGDQLLRHADSAMYRAKGAGGNTLCYFAPDTDAQVHRTLDLRGEVMRALAEGELRLHYQPQVDLQTQALVGLEALLRWQHPLRGLLAPDAFLPALEDTSLIDGIGDWVLHEAARQVVAWRGGPLAGLPVSVNVSPLQLRGAGFVSRINTLLGLTGVRPGELALEVTERAILVNGAAASQALRDLHQMGLAIALDDFGTGYSSLSHLHQHPISQLKIDRSFCQSVPADRNAGAIVRAIIDMARSMHIGLVAEGVETADQAAYLSAAGCTVAQGHLFAQAQPPAVLQAWCEARALH